MVLSIPLGLPWAIFSDSNAIPLTSSSDKPRLKWLLNPLMIATAIAADPPKPIPLGMSGNTSIRIPLLLKLSRSRIAPAGFSNDCLCSISLSNWYSIPQDGIISVTPSLQSSTLTRIVCGTGTAMAWRP